MSGHSKWDTIHRAKAITDAKRGAVFTKMANLITIAAREKGGDSDTNFSLRIAMTKAKLANMPKDNIERAIKKGTGELGGEQIIELYYEGIGPYNSQFVVKCITDNKNRSASSVRHIFTKADGSLSPVMWNFDRKGVINVEADNLDDLELELIDAGAEDIFKDDEGLTIHTDISNLHNVKDVLEKKGIIIKSADLEYVPKETQKLDESKRDGFNKFIDTLDDCEDVSDFYTNIDF